MDLASLGKLRERLRRVLDLPEEEAPVTRFEQGATAQSFGVEKPTEVKHSFRSHDGALKSLPLNPSKKTEVAQGGQHVPSQLLACALAPSPDGNRTCLVSGEKI